MEIYLKPDERGQRCRWTTGSRRSVDRHLGGRRLDYFLKTVFNYPTLAECYKTAAFHAANKLVLISRAKTFIDGNEHA